MAKKARKKVDPAWHIVATALALAREKNWREIRLADIAAAAKISETDLGTHFSSKRAILEAFNTRINNQVIDPAPGPAAGETIRDQLFELIMARFDALNPHKDALAAILRATVPFDPKTSISGLCAVKRSMRLSLEKAGDSASGIEKIVKVKALSLLYLRIFYIWLGDESGDMSKTMAALDKALARAEALASRNWCVTPRATAGENG